LLLRARRVSIIRRRKGRIDLSQPSPKERANTNSQYILTLPSPKERVNTGHLFF
jgi:hypothetical protein